MSSLQFTANTKQLQAKWPKNPHEHKRPWTNLITIRRVLDIGEAHVVRFEII
jgi:hypothetical protein